MTLRRSPSLSDQVKAYLRQRIVNNEFADGRIPGEIELAGELGVSRTTVREALSRLEHEGAIYRRQGAGTFVNRPGLQVKSRLDEIWGYEEMLRAHGFTPSTRILGWEQVAAPGDVAEDLRLRPRDRLWRMRKLFLQDETPVILTVNYLPVKLAAAEVDEAALHWPMYAFVRAFGRSELAYYLTDIVPLSADSDLAAALHISAHTPLLSFEETGYTHDHQPILKAFSYFRDDLLRLRILRRSRTAD